MQYLIDPQNGSAYWCDAGALMFAPLSTDHTFDTAESGEVDFGRLDNEDRARMETVKGRLC